MKKLILGLAVGSLLLGQEKVDEATTAKMRSEELEHSQILRTLHTLTDRYGPRVTGSPNHEAAAKWAVSQMTAWGLNEGRGYGVHDAGNSSTGAAATRRGERGQGTWRAAR